MTWACPYAIRSAINYLQAGDAGPLTEKQSEYLLMVSNNSTAHLTAFINNLLTTARIEAAKVDPGNWNWWTSSPM